MKRMMKTVTCRHSVQHPRQTGAALLVAMILLAALTLIGVAAVNTGVMEMRMARNVEDQMEAFQVSHAALDFVISNPANLPTVGALKTECEYPADEVALTGGLFDPDTDRACVVRTVDCGLPPRGVGPSSLLAFSSFAYKIEADVDKRPSGRGESRQRQGYLTLGPKC